MKKIALILGLTILFVAPPNWAEVSTQYKEGLVIREISEADCKQHENMRYVNAGGGICIPDIEGYIYAKKGFYILPSGIVHFLEADGECFDKDNP